MAVVHVAFSADHLVTMATTIDLNLRRRYRQFFHPNFQVNLGPDGGDAIDADDVSQT